MPLSDFGSPDPDFTQEQVDQCARIIRSVRAINTKIVRLSGSVEDLAAAADRIETLSASLDAITQSRAMESFRFEFDTSEPDTPPKIRRLLDTNGIALCYRKATTDHPE